MSIYPDGMTVTGKVLPAEFGPGNPPPGFFAEDAMEANLPGPQGSPKRHAVQGVHCLFCTTAGEVALRLEDAAFVCQSCRSKWGPLDVREHLRRWQIVLQLVEQMTGK